MIGRCVGECDFFGGAWALKHDQWLLAADRVDLDGSPVLFSLCLSMVAVLSLRIKDLMEWTRWTFHSRPLRNSESRGHLGAQTAKLRNIPAWALLAWAVLVGLAAVEVARLVIDVAPFDRTSIVPVLVTLENRISSSRFILEQ